MKWFRYIGITAAILVALSCASLFLFNWLTSSRSAAVAASLRAKGQPMTVADLNRRVPPDSRNGAPLYEEAFSMVDSRQLRGYMQSVWSAISDAQQTPERWTLVGSDTDVLAPVYDLLEQAAAMPECGFRVRETAQGIWPRCYERAVKCEMLCRARATVAVRRGDRRETARMLRLLLDMGHSFGYEPCVGIHMQRRAVSCFTDALQDVVTAGALTPETVETMWKGLDRLDPQRSYVRTLEGDRVSFGCSGASMRVVDAYGNPVQRVWSAAVAPSRVATLVTVATSHLDHANLLYRETVGPRGVHPWESIAGDGGGMLDAEAQSVANTRCFRDQLSAVIAGDQAYLAILLYKMKRGCYPASLADAAALAGRSLRVDPFSGKPFMYARKGSGFLLYSVGNDLKDNGGARRRSNGRIQFEDIDIVWTEPRP